MRRVYFAAALLPAFLLLGCGPNHQPKTQASATPPKPVARASATIEDVKAKVLAKLKDPESAHFEDLRQVHLVGIGNGSTLDAVCGRVNAKNAMGGYNGFLPFAYINHVDDRDIVDNVEDEHFSENHFILEDAGDDSYERAWHQEDVDHLCGDQTRFATDDEMLLTGLGRSTREREAQSRQMWDTIHREQARRDALAAHEQATQDGTSASSPGTAMDDGTNTVATSQ